MGLSPHSRHSSLYASQAVCSRSRRQPSRSRYCKHVSYTFTCELNPIYANYHRIATHTSGCEHLESPRTTTTPSRSLSPRHAPEDTDASGHSARTHALIHGGEAQRASCRGATCPQESKSRAPLLPQVLNYEPNDTLVRPCTSMMMPATTIGTPTPSITPEAFL